jgi:hypothetical protein
MTIKRLPIIGLGLTVAGLLLVVGFWPLTSVSGAKLLASRNGNQYSGYVVGSRITIHEEVLDVSYLPNFLGRGRNLTRLVLNDGDPNQTTAIYVLGDASGVVAPGEVIFASAVLRVIQSVSFYYWEVATPGDVHPSWPVDALFYGVMATGVVVLGVAAFRRP